MTRITWAAVFMSVLWMTGFSAAAQQQSAERILTSAQRTTLQSVLAAVDQATSAAETPNVEWQTHVLRASDGSHYVAFSVTAPPGLIAKQPVALYVRLATRRDPRIAARPERSAVAEWLAGNRSTPVRPERGIAFVDMPIYGPGAAASRPQAPQGLRLLEMERERARERREERERARKATLEGETPRASDALLPFEDFDLNVIPASDNNGAPVLRRSLTAGPGEYVLTVAWRTPTPTGTGGAVTLLKRGLSLPIASTSEFGLSSPIVADEIKVREIPVGSDEQSGQPYSIGTTEIVPAHDVVFTPEERLALIVQVINPRATPDGKPDVTVGFRVFRTTPTGPEHVGDLKPQIYNHATLPPDFAVMKRHPIFAAVEIPLQSFKRGDYRINIMADDRLGGVSATTEARFTIRATPALLLGDAPALASPFRREEVLTPAVVGAIVDSLRAPQPSAALARALDAARERRFVDLVREDSIGADEQGIRATLRALALFALGDTPTAVGLPLRQALQVSAPTAAVHMLLGAARALDGNDREAVVSWNAAVDAGIDLPVMRLLLMDSYLRLGNGQQAIDLGGVGASTPSSDRAFMRRLAAAHIAIGRRPDAIALLNRVLQQEPTDADAQWLMLHALFADIVQSDPPSDRTAKERFRQLVQAYVDAKGRHAGLATEWADAIR